MISARTKAALAAAKRRGKVLGGLAPEVAPRPATLPVPGAAWPGPDGRIGPPHPATARAPSVSHVPMGAVA
jgi:hypothetical protein